MAEHNIIRRVGGGMEPRRGITSRRVLLPQEVELCNLLGLSEEEYWYFVDKTESYNGKRSEAYDLIPDIRCDPISASFWVQLAIGVALTVVSYLMTPKPKQPKTPPSLKTADQSGVRRFAPQAGFGSVQELAKLGETIPLVFTKRENGHGGIRVNTKLIWSQMLSQWTGQQLKALFLISNGTIEEEPDFAGYAIGETTLANYSNAKIALYSKLGGGRIKESDRYEDQGSLPQQGLDIGKPLEDVFSVIWTTETWKPNVMCGSRSPRVQSQFGAFSPMANAMRFMVPYELVLKGKNLSDDNKRDIDRKRTKIETAFPRYAAITASGGSVDSRVTYTISSLNPAEQEHFDDEFDPWGMEDVKSSVDADRINSDNNLAIGDSYLIGSALAFCENVTYTQGAKIWIPDTETTVTATFKVTDQGIIDPAKDVDQAHHPYELTVIQRAAIGTISNNINCDVTEIGIKSTVWRQITGFANVNSHPGHITYGEEGTVKRYEDDNGNIQLGQLSKYVKRYSFFHLEARISGQNPPASWTNIDGGIPFAVRGIAPQPQYNFVRIVHSRANQYEFRFVPYPGNLVQRNLQDNALMMIRLFQKDIVSEVAGQGTGFTVYYSGKLQNLTGNQASNSEWYLGELPDVTSENSIVMSFIKDHKGDIPVTTGWQLVGEKNYSDDYDDGVSSGAYFVRPYSKKFANNGYYINLHVYYNDEKIGVIEKHYRGSANNKWDSDNLWPRNINEILDNETWSIEKDGYQYRTGEINSGSTEFSSNSRDQKFSVRKYQWDDRTASFTQTDNVATTVISGVDLASRSPSGLTLTVNVYNNNPYGVSWQIKNGGSGYASGDVVRFTIPNKGSATIDTVVLTDSGSLVTDAPWPEGRNLNPYDAIADFVRYDAERSSHLDGPEHEIAYCNEHVLKSNIDYDNLACAGLRLNSSKEWNSFSQLSAYVKKGITVERLIEDGEGATNLFPEIAYALLTDPTIGAGELIGKLSVDEKRMETAAQFCRANGFFWDGVITESQNLREFIFQQASFCLLDFTILAGKFSLVPAVPYNATDYTIDHSAKPPIKALFTDGNIKDLKVSFLSPEERQIFKGRAMYRHETENGFPETKVIEKGLSIGSLDDPIETFDLSNFCTTDDHAEKFLKYALRVRELVDHGIKFSTTPQAAMHLAPGEYFRLFSESTHTSRFENGSISSDGTVQSIGLDPLTDADIFYWRAGMEEVKAAKLTITNGKANDATLNNSVFTLKKTNTSDRVYKVESLSYGEEGLIEIAGSHVPLTATGSLAILNWDDNDFT